MQKRLESGVDFAINGKHYNVNPSLDKFTGESRLVDYIRDNAGLKGTKFMCREGGCGACVVSVRTKDPVTGEEVTKSVNSCLTPVYSCNGWDITTVENVGNKTDGYHPIQKRLAQFHGTQCGFCSPGFVMNMYSLLESKSEVNIQDVEDNFDGNICRCTGYRPILDAFKSMAIDAPEELRKQCTVDIEDCGSCPKRQASNGTTSAAASPSQGNVAGKGGLKHLLAKDSGLAQNKFKLPSGEQWIQAGDVKSALSSLEQLKSGDLKYRVVAGNTGSGVYKHDGPYEAYLDINGITELKQSTLDAKGVVLGSGVTLTRAIDLLQQASSLDGYSYTALMGKHLERVANVPVRNLGTLAGNLMLKHAHPEFQSDVFVIFETAGARINVAAPTGSAKAYSLVEFLALDMKGKLILSLHLPPRSNVYVYRSYKITKRYQNAHAYVNAGFLFKLDASQNYKVLEKPRIVFGGISAEFSHATATETYLQGKCLGDESVLKGALETLEKEVQPDLRPSESSKEYRKTLTKSLLYKTILGIIDEKTNASLKSGKSDIEKKMSRGEQHYEKDESDSVLYKNISKLEGIRQVAGEAEYVGDIPQFRDELVAVYVLSTVANASVKSIDASEALKVPGVERFISADDIQGDRNQYMKFIDFFPTKNVEPIFAKEKISHYGQPLGLLLATTREIGRAAVSKVKVEYENIERPIVDIDTALEKTKTEGTTDKFICAVFPSKDQSTEAPKNSVKGEFYVGGQYHFYMETQACVCVPKEDGIDVYAATQWKDHVQQTISDVLDIPCSNVNVYVRRLGGGFGGKAGRYTQVAAACALAASLCKKPVRLIMDMEDNTSIIGMRPNYLLKYDVGFDDNGKIEKLNTEIIGDIGWGLNEPLPLICAIHLQGPYAAMGWLIKAISLPTNTASTTFCRAPGSPQAALLIETIMEHVAHSVGKDVLDVRAVNYMKAGDALIPAGVFEGENYIPRLIDEVKVSGEYEERKKFVAKFNSENRWKKRGMSLVPVRYHLGYMATKYPVQIVVYHKDGSIAVSHAGIEMGQGINTKVAQTVSHFLNIPIDRIQIKPSNTFVAANSMLTAGSNASELCCDTAMRACQVLMERMKPIREKLENPSWDALVKECYNKNVNMNVHYMHTAADEVKPYNIWLVALTEVEVDILTGEYKVLRADIIEDAGKSLSPGVDIGQVEGSYVFGQGLFTSEKLVFDKDTGKLLTNNTWEYKPPESKDIPEDFRVTLLSNAPNPHGVLSSKATGEPMVCGSAAVVFALKNAIAAARKDAGHEEWFQIDTPITPEAVVKMSLSADGHFRY